MITAMPRIDAEYPTLFFGACSQYAKATMLITEMIIITNGRYAKIEESGIISRPLRFLSS